MHLGHLLSILMIPFVVLVLASLGIIALTVLVGDAGARAVWGKWKI